MRLFASAVLHKDREYFVKKIYKIVLPALLCGWLLTAGQLGWAQERNTTPIADPSTLLTAAERVVGLVDQGLASELWPHVSVAVKEMNSVNEEDFSHSIYNVRRPLGVVMGRYWVNISQTVQPENAGMPHGRYVTVSFVTNFAGKSGMSERVTFLLDEDGIWRIAGYTLL